MALVADAILHGMVCVAPPPQGSVGFSIKFYDMCLAVINAHLAADLKGRNRV